MFVFVFDGRGHAGLASIIGGVYLMSSLYIGPFKDSVAVIPKQLTSEVVWGSVTDMSFSIPNGTASDSLGLSQTSF